MHRFTKKTIFRCSVVLIIIAIGCSKTDNDDKEAQIKNQRNILLGNIFTNEIAPLNDAFILATQTLQNDAETFKGQITLQNLENLQMQWIAVLKIWKRLELYNFGAIEDSFIHYEINRWPTNVTTINTYIDGTETLNEAFIASKGSSSKGISAIEYLLFSTSDNDAVLSSFNTDLNYERRLDYLVALTANLKTKAEDLAALWEAYQPDYIAALEDGIDGSLNQLTNAIIVLIEEISNSKLGNALGDKNGGYIDNEALEAYRSKTSLIIIQEHLNALYRCYTGHFIEEDTTQYGFDDYLIFLDSTTLNDDIINAFNTCQEKIDAINNPLYEEIINNTQNVTDLQQAFKDLLVLVKIDLANATDTTVTISDNDGD